MLIKKEKALCVFIVIMLLFSLCNAAFADEPSISHVVIEIDNEMVVFTIEEYGLAMAAGKSDQTYNFMAAGNVPRVRAVCSGDKFMAIGTYGLAFAEAGNIAGAIERSPAQEADLVETYKVFGGFDGEGDPILFPLFPASYEVTFGVVGNNGELTAEAGGAAITSGAQVQEGSDVVFTAAPAEGYRVKEWKQDGVVVSGLTALTYTVKSLASDLEVTVEFEAITAQVSELYRDGVSARYEDTVYNGIRELVPGVYNVELEMDKITAKFGDISGCSVRLIVNGKVVKGENQNANIIDSFIVEKEYAVLPAVQQGIQDEEIVINPATLAEGIVLLVPAPPSSAPVSELYREGVGVLYEGEVCNGVRELVPGAYNVELEMNKIVAKFGDISGCSLRLTIDGKVVKGEDSDENIIDTFIVEDDYVFLPAVQQGIQDEEIVINPATLAEAIVIKDWAN